MLAEAVKAVDVIEYFFITSDKTRPKRPLFASNISFTIYKKINLGSFIATC